jgi:conjugal transfer/entry exclusion protein
MEKVFGKASTIKYIDSKNKMVVIVGKNKKTFDIKTTKEPINKTIDKQIKNKENVQKELNQETKKLQSLFLKQLNNNNQSSKNKSQIVKELGYLTNKIESIDYTLRQLRDYQETHKNRTIRTIQF